MSQKGIVGKYDNDDIIYYNGSIVNSQLQSQTQSFVLANFVDSRTQPILDKADDYYMKCRKMEHSYEYSTINDYATS